MKIAIFLKEEYEFEIEDKVIVFEKDGKMIIPLSRFPETLNFNKNYSHFWPETMITLLKEKVIKIEVIPDGNKD